MLENPFKILKKHEWLLWGISLAVTLLSNIAAGRMDIITLSATVIGVTSLIFTAAGNVFGQILMVVFSFLYAVTSFEYRYYGEMVTYLGMTMPIAAISVYTWLKNPSEQEKNTVKIRRMRRAEISVMSGLTVVVTCIFYFILKMLATPNLMLSTLSVVTSFIAVYLTMYRNAYYALAYAANDVVLIILWILASADKMIYFPMVICFVMFLINDIYGFISWKIREKKQK